MKQLLAMIVTTLFVSPLCSANGGYHKLLPFVGLWEAVDPSDGSLTQRSISCHSRHRCSVLGSDSFWVLCGSPRGRLVGEGFADRRGLRIPDFTLTCTETEQKFVVDTTFVVDPKNGTLLETHTNPNIPTIVFHRTSR